MCGSKRRRQRPTSENARQLLAISEWWSSAQNGDIWSFFLRHRFSDLKRWRSISAKRRVAIPKFLSILQKDHDIENSCLVTADGLQSNVAWRTFSSKFTNLNTNFSEKKNKILMSSRYTSSSSRTRRQTSSSHLDPQQQLFRGFVHQVL